MAANNERALNLFCKIKTTISIQIPYYLLDRPDRRSKGDLFFRIFFYFDFAFRFAFFFSEFYARDFIRFISFIPFCFSAYCCRSGSDRSRNFSVSFIFFFFFAFLFCSFTFHMTDILSCIFDIF